MRRQGSSVSPGRGERMAGQQAPSAVRANGMSTPNRQVSFSGPPPTKAPLQQTYEHCREPEQAQAGAEVSANDGRSCRFVGSRDEFLAW